MSAVRFGSESSTWQRFHRRRTVRAAMVWIVFLVAVALLRHVIAGSHPIAGELYPPVDMSPDEIRLDERLRAPGGSHWLGTDELGRDLLSRMIHGTAVSVTVGVTAAAISILIGVVLGGIAGFYGGAADWIISRLIDVFLCFPFLLVVLAIVAFWGPSIWTIIIALGVTAWTTEARFIRAEFLRLREAEFTHAARASGARDWRIMVHHLLPNALAPVLVSTSFSVASAILLESALSFLGFGVPLPAASWGSVLSSADDYLAHAWWLALFPGIAIFLTAVSYNVLGEELREAMDPRS